MSESSGSNNNHVTYWGILQIMFIGLKLAGLIDWPWWQVFLPIIIYCAIVVFIFVIALIIEYMD